MTCINIGEYDLDDSRGIQMSYIYICRSIRIGSEGIIWISQGNSNGIAAIRMDLQD